MKYKYGISKGISKKKTKNWFSLYADIIRKT